MQNPSAAGPAPRTRLARLGALIARHPRTWIVAWAVVAITCFAVAVGGVTGESLFERLHSGAPTVESESSRAQEVIAESQPALETLTMQVTGADLADAATVAAGTAATREVAQVPGVKSVRSPLLAPGGVTDPSVAPLLKGGTPTAGGFVTVVDFAPGLDKAAQDAAETQAEARLLGVATAMHAQGSVGSTSKVIEAITTTVERDLLRGEGIALPLTFVVMFFVFGGFVAAGMPIVGAVVSIGGALLSLFGFSHVVELDATVVNIVTLLGLGLSIDYGLLTVSRFREELAHREHDVPTRAEIAHAAERTVATAGRTVLFSGLTVAIALAGLLIFEASIMRAIGVAGVSVVLVAMVVAITLVPALCVVGAKRLSRKAVEKPSDVGLFSRLAVGVQRRPVAVILGVVVVLVTLALPTLSMKLTSSGTELLPKDAPQRVFFEQLDRDYPALSAPEVTVVARTADTAAVTAWSQQFRSRPGVEGLVVRPLGSGDQRVDIRVAGRPTSDEAQDLVTTIRATSAPFETLTTGQAAGQIDFLDSMSARAPYAVALVVLGTFVLLFLMTGSVVLPVKALLLNVISLGAALGVVVWIFQEGHLEGLLGFTSVGALESMVPFLVLAFGFGLSMDYEVFLLSRIVEFHRHGAGNDRAVSLGLQRTGRIITSAALLIVIVFGGFVAGDILIIKEMGVALVAAVVIDATLVRMLLVPATMTVLGRWNWWAPAPMRRLHDRFGITE
ncbi:multidrug RND transporter [Terrabacter sp. Root85]|uniref:MMPL family transporter n=1 Tax=unclassified Terrabacter TaxID=2630222 RepID=UPI0006FEFF3D|nr:MULTISPECIES: MMPL family transporter [unclassified Terrabacter]KRC86756.1 multidrug RND transporter [Terrabacter sp. Root85]KRF44700.1 multidrug RND transporter [Terrabacter sp. Soil811]